MHICTVDGKVVFAKWVVGETPAFTEKERDKLIAESGLRPKAITFPKETIEKAEGIKYASRSEAIAHLTEDREPESEKITRLIRRVEAAEEELVKIKQRESEKSEP